MLEKAALCPSGHTSTELLNAIPLPGAHWLLGNVVWFVELLKYHRITESFFLEETLKNIEFQH